MPALGKIAFAVVTGGIALGAMLGAAADPAMKSPPEQPWHGTLQAPVTADAEYQLTGAEGVSPYHASYAPSWADEELADWEPNYPAWTYSGHGSELAGDLDSGFDEDQAAPPVDAQSPVPAPSVSEVSPQPGDPGPLAPEPQIAGKLAALY